MFNLCSLFTIESYIQASPDTLSSSRSKTTVRRYLLVTLSHCEARNVSQFEAMARLKQLFTCRSILVSRESHKSGGFHYHIGIDTTDASKNNYNKLVRKAFPEFEGMQLDVQAKKGWGPICAYLTKEDKSPLIWGETNLHQILQIAKAYRSRRKSQGFSNKGKKAIYNNPFFFLKRPRSSFFLYSAICGILTYQTIYHVLHLEIPPLSLFRIRRRDFAK